MSQTILEKQKNEIIVRNICKEQGLNKDEEDLICRIIHCESGFDSKAVLVNKDGTKDLGIIQANQKWYIRKGKFLTEDEAMNDIEKCVKVMIQRYRAGWLKDWVCYKKKLYLKFSGKV